MYKIYDSVGFDCEDAISDAFVIGDEDTFLNIEHARERLRSLHYSHTEQTVMIEGWIADALF